MRNYAKWLITFLSVMIVVSGYSQKENTEERILSGKFPFKVELDKKLSSKGTDACPFFMDDKGKTMIFVSTRETYKDKKQKKLPIHHLYYTSKKKGWKKPTRITHKNTQMSSGAVGLDRKRNVIFYTKCGTPRKRLSGGKENACQIFYSFLLPSCAMFGEPLRLQIPGIHMKGDYVFGHPFFSNELDILFFTSDMPGGQGKTDVWYSKYDRVNDTWSEPVNLGPKINSPESDILPSLDANGNLYFSSKGHKGQGGFDVFVAPKKEEGWGKPVNLGKNFNTVSNEVGITLNEDGGYFTSDRSGGVGGLDIYSFSYSKMIEEGDTLNYEDTTMINSLSLLFNKEECELGEEIQDASDAKIFPNPNNGEFTLNFTSNKDNTLIMEIHNSMGQVVSMDNVEVQKGSVERRYNLSNVNNGIYYINIKDGCDLVKTVRMVVSKN